MPSEPHSLSDFDQNMAPLAGSTSPMRWSEPDVSPFRLSGFAWYEQDRIYRRLPLAGRDSLPVAVDGLADHTAGGQIAFRSDSSQVAVRVELAGPADMNHMPATGQCGFDLYLGPPGSLLYHGTSVYDRLLTEYEALLFEHPDAKMRDFTLNFPLYQGVKRVQIGLLPEATVAPPKPWAASDRIVFYGTSVTQGGCASRPGMAYTNILSRALNCEVINLGFSGSGKGEPAVIRAVASIPDPRLIVLDYEANTQGDLAETLPDAIDILRSRHRTVPILVVSRFSFAKDLTHQDVLHARNTNRDLQAGAVEKKRAGGDPHVHFFDGSTLLGPDAHECTVDGIHPNDLGFMQMARSLEPVLRDLLDQRQEGNGDPGSSNRFPARSCHRFGRHSARL
jgi:lysophospholipase L1-like esterase